jgi:hypothetical protein
MVSAGRMMLQRQVPEKLQAVTKYFSGPPSAGLNVVQRLENTAFPRREKNLSLRILFRALMSK